MCMRDMSVLTRVFGQASHRKTRMAGEILPRRLDKRVGSSRKMWMSNKNVGSCLQRSGFLSSVLLLDLNPGLQSKAWARRGRRIRFPGPHAAHRTMEFLNFSILAAVCIICSRTTAVPGVARLWAPCPNTYALWFHTQEEIGPRILVMES
jgi:hypothetical protein